MFTVGFSESLGHTLIHYSKDRVLSYVFLILFPPISSTFLYCLVSMPRFSMVFSNNTVDKCIFKFSDGSYVTSLINLSSSCTVSQFVSLLSPCLFANGL